MFESLLRVLILMAVVAAVIVCGWNEPLRYRFLSANQIATEEQAIQPEMVARDSQHQLSPAGTSLDRAHYEVHRGTVYYSDKFDPKRMGNATETPWKPNIYGGANRGAGR